MDRYVGVKIKFIKQILAIWSIKIPYEELIDLIEKGEENETQNQTPCT